MEDLREKLKEKFEFMDYFKIAFEVMSDLMINEKMWVILLYILIYIGFFCAIILVPNIELNIITISFLNFFTTFIGLILGKKIIFKIENREFTLKENFYKYVILAFILNIVPTFAYIHEASLNFIFLNPNSYLGLESFDSFIFLFLSICISLFIYPFFMYIIPSYISREKTLQESIDYNLDLSKGNRFQIIIPIILVQISSKAIFAIINAISFLIPNFGDILIYSSIISFIQSFFMLFVYLIITVLINIIFLNVEYRQNNK